MSATVLTTIAGGIARIALNRPEKRNALKSNRLAALTAELQSCAGNSAVRMVQITGVGKAFCAGADLADMQEQSQADEAANLKDAAQLAALFSVILEKASTALPPANYMAWPIPIGVAIAIAVIMTAAALISVRRVLVLEPATVFC